MTTSQPWSARLALALDKLTLAPDRGNITFSRNLRKEVAARADKISELFTTAIQVWIFLNQLPSASISAIFGISPMMPLLLEQLPVYTPLKDIII